MANNSPRQRGTTFGGTLKSRSPRKSSRSVSRSNSFKSRMMGKTIQNTTKYSKEKDQTTLLSSSEHETSFQTSFENTLGHASDMNTSYQSFLAGTLIERAQAR